MKIELKRSRVVIVTNAAIALAMLALVWQHVIDWKAAMGGLALLLAPSIAKRARGKEERTRKDDDDGPPSSGGVTPLIVTSVLMCLLSCASATPQEKSAAADASYMADQLACVDKASTIEESRACRAKVREQWHVDGGAK